MDTAYTLIGIDGGATKASGWIVNFQQNPLSFSLSEINVQTKYSDIEGFINDYQPVPVQEQLKQASEDKIILSDHEKQQGDVLIKACAQVIQKLAEKEKGKSVLVGIGMPGLKTADLRGINVVANGPRMPLYAQKVETILSQNKIKLAAPIAHLGSDADYCGIGENYAEGGGFSNVYNAYYLGGGTGAADALKLRGELVPLDKTKEWLAKTWEMKNELDISMEKYASASGIQFIYSNKSNINIDKLNKDQIFPPQIAEKALAGESAAIETYREISKYLAMLFYDRIASLYCGSQNIFSFVNPNRPALSNDHFYREDTFERIVVGQRLSDLMGSKSGNEVLTKPLAKVLSNLIDNSDCLPESVKSYYLHASKLKNERLYLSKLREAPAIGAGIDAYLTYTKKN